MPSAAPTIVLFTDFGLAGPYTGQMKAVLRRMAPESELIDLFADAPIGNPKASAYLLAAYTPWFPAGTVFLCVVDPGVGGARAPLIIEAGGCRYVGPDNGLFELVLRRASAARVTEITWRPETLSMSFHGRDLFAPAAAKLAAGEAFARREHAPLRFPQWPDDLAEIVYVDHYGNAMTGMRAASLAKETVLTLAPDRRIAHAKTFSAVKPGDAFWYENSNGLAEIAVNLGRADAALGLAIGSAVGLAT
ncbi:MAG TPA: SAM-dependent chlorinase/fluorinase [Stellaceae bacterium]|nr:SAM-dependent chlorinase/fluorinase [Stellaceae bacterium]